MQVSAESLMEVSNEILDFSKMQSDRLALELADCHIGELLLQVKTLFQGKLQEKGLSLTIFKPAVDEMAVRGDSNRLRQVLTNLLSNAIKLIERDGIKITWKYVDEMIGPPSLYDSEISESSCILTNESVKFESQGSSKDPGIKVAGRDHDQLSIEVKQATLALEILQSVQILSV